MTDDSDGRSAGRGGRDEIFSKQTVDEEGGQGRRDKMGGRKGCVGGGGSGD